jgi:hypothetical protein
MGSRLAAYTAACTPNLRISREQIENEICTVREASLHRVIEHALLDNKFTAELGMKFETRIA